MCGLQGVSTYWPSSHVGVCFTWCTYKFTAIYCESVKECSHYAIFFVTMFNTDMNLIA